MVEDSDPSISPLMPVEQVPVFEKKYKTKLLLKGCLDVFHTPHDHDHDHDHV